MPKTGGMGDSFYLGGFDVSGDINSLGKIGGGPAALPATNITQSAEARMGGVRDGGIDFVSYWNPGPEANAAHTVLSALPTADVIASYFRGTAVGNPAACLVSKQVNYDPTRGQDGSLTFACSLQANGYGLEFNGVQHTAGIQTDASATNSAGMDGLAATAFGAQAYLQVFALATGTATVKFQDFTSDTPASYTDITSLAFAPVAAAGFAPQAQRIAIANTATVRRWTRVVTTGTFTGLQFAVVLVRNPIAGQVF